MRRRIGAEKPQAGGKAEAESKLAIAVHRGSDAAFERLVVAVFRRIASLEIDRSWYGPAGHPRQWRIARPRSGEVMPISADGSERPATFQARTRTVSVPYCPMKNEVASAGAKATGKK